MLRLHEFLKRTYATFSFNNKRSKGSPGILIILNLFLVYISWGSVYIGLKFTLEVVGPFLACGLRMTLAGTLFCALLIITKNWQKVKLSDWKNSFLQAVFLVLVASGFLSKGEEYVSSGVAAMVNGTTPISMLLGMWLFGRENRPTLLQCVGLAGGFFGLCLLAPHEDKTSELFGIFWVLGATLGWVAGSILLKNNVFKISTNPLQSCAMLLFCGGLESVLVAFFAGEFSHIHLHELSLTNGIAFAWMVIGGSIIAYSSYFWLLRNVSVPLAISYEYVVPIIGIFLGAVFYNETISMRSIFSCFLIVGSVFFIISQKSVMK